MSACRIRRRGDVLLDAVFAATMAQIADVGLRRLSMEGIASRAGTGKAALYRRWPNVRALVIDALANSIEEAAPLEPTTTGSLRLDLIAVYCQVSSTLNSSAGKVLLELIAEARRDPEMMVELKTRYAGRRHLATVLFIEQAMLRGEIPRQTPDPYVMRVGPALIWNQLTEEGSAPTNEQVRHIVDSIVLPLLSHQSVVVNDA